MIQKAVKGYVGCPMFSNWNSRSTYSSCLPSAIGGAVMWRKRTSRFSLLGVFPTVFGQISKSLYIINSWNYSHDFFYSRLFFNLYTTDIILFMAVFQELFEALSYVCKLICVVHVPIYIFMLICQYIQDEECHVR